MDARAQRRRRRRAQKPSADAAATGRAAALRGDMVAVRWVALFEDMRGDCSTSDHADGDDPDSDLRADAAARKQCDCAFAHAALPDRGRVDTEAVQQESSLARRASSSQPR